MESAPTVSILISTYNRAEHLQQTLDALAKLRILDALPTELLILDNGSTDATEAVTNSCALPGVPARYVREARTGKTVALNTGLTCARGEIILFTDDDVRPSPDWIAGMCAPILAGRADAVAGGVRIAPHLLRAWMQPIHREFLASTETLDADAPRMMIGANMAFHRCVLAKVPAFDTELGPGALGVHEETLFSRQLLTAGYRLAAALDASVEHHFEASRLQRASFENRLRYEAVSAAYVAYHWEHRQDATLRLRLLRHLLRLRYGKLRSAWPYPEGMPVWEMQSLNGLGFYKGVSGSALLPAQLYKAWSGQTLPRSLMALHRAIFRLGIAVLHNLLMEKSYVAATQNRIFLST